jgi:hypothetical protein
LRLLELAWQWLEKTSNTRGISDVWVYHVAGMLLYWPGIFLSSVSKNASFIEQDTASGGMCVAFEAWEATYATA